jgi:hydrogenase nickel incorporation protein HypB
MCSVCGCGEAQVVLDKDNPAGGHAHAADHAHPHGHEHDHDHDHDHGHRHHDEGMIDYGQGAAGAHAPGVSQERMVAIERDILSKNDAYARDNRRALAAKGVFALNFVSSPGSGKTTLLARTIEALKGRLPVSVIEGDQQTSNDAERIRAAGAPAIQINTGKGCHLDAHMVGHAIESLDPQPNSALFIENVGNLVCPAGFDLGEAHKVVVLSVTEGEDKPLKYPDMFVAADLLLLNKSDLLPYLEFDVGLCLANALRINPHLQTLVVSAKTGEGLAAFVAWIEASAARRAAALAKA